MPDSDLVPVAVADGNQQGVAQKWPGVVRVGLSPPPAVQGRQPRRGGSIKPGAPAPRIGPTTSPQALKGSSRPVGSELGFLFGDSGSEGFDAGGVLLGVCVGNF
jgi:hypothetical protein